MRLSRPYLLPICPCLALPMSLLLLAGLAGCGPAPSEKTPTLGPHASQGEPPLSQKNQPLRTDPFASSASSAPASLVPNAIPASSTQPANPMDDLVVPSWIAKDLSSPDVDTRLRALDTWVLTAPVGSIDPLLLAFGNGDERVQARAMELIKQDLVRAAEGGE